MPPVKSLEKEILQLLTQKKESVFAAKSGEQEKVFSSKSSEPLTSFAGQFVLWWTPLTAGTMW